MADGFEYDITSDLIEGGTTPAAAPDTVQHGSQDRGAALVTPPGAEPRTAVDALPPEKAQPDNSVRDTLTAAFKGTDNKPTDQQGATSAAPPALTKDSAGKYRLTDGTFANADQVAAFERAQAPAANTTDQAKPPLLEGLTPVELQQFQSLPAELRQYVERTMEGLNTRAARYGEYDRIEQGIIASRREAFQQQGYTPETAISQLFQLSDFAGNDPSNFVLWFAKQHDLDLDALLDARDAADTAGASDPQIAALKGEVQTLAGQVQGMTAERQAQEHQARLTNVQNFAVEKDDKGALKRQYLPDVMDDWPHHITAIKAANPTMPSDEVLQKAYDAACWANPNVRSKMQQAASAGRITDPAAVKQARGAAVSITGAPSGNVSTTPNNSARTVRDELQAAFASARA